MAINIAGKQAPKTGLEGKFSLYYCVANALLRGHTGIQAFTDEKVNEPEIKKFMEKITVIPDPKILHLEANVEVKTNSNTVFQGFSDILNEIPELEIKKGKVQNKFMDLCAPVLGKNKSKEIMEALLALEDLKNMKNLIERIHGVASA